MPLVDARHLPSVALSFMNDDHHLEGCLLNELADALEEHRRDGVSSAAVLDGLDALLAHTREHFAREEAAMEEAGFPAYPVHKAEHDRVLDELDAEARAFRERHDVKRLAAFLADLPRWLVQHIQSMDLVTSHFIARSQTFA